MIMAELSIGKPIGIPPAEYAARQARLREECNSREVAAACVFDPDYVKYYSGFYFGVTERPMAFVLSAEGETALFVPRLEREHAQARGSVDQVWDYEEYPGTTHPMEQLAEALRGWSVGGNVLLADEDGYPWLLGYRGPPLSELLGCAVLPARAFIEDCLMVKSPLEIELLRQSAVWGNYGLARLTTAHPTRPVRKRSPANGPKRKPGRPCSPHTGRITRRIHPISAAARASNTAGRSGAIRPYRIRSATTSSSNAAIRSSARARWLFGAIASSWSVPSSSARRARSRCILFKHMLALQETAFAEIGPGRPCSVVDDAVRAYFVKHDLERYRRHHVGHGIGLRYHEGPFLDVGDSTEMQPGMVFTVEPGLFDARWGGFRHSDTVLVTETGNELLTHYPRDLASCTLPVS